MAVIGRITPGFVFLGSISFLSRLADECKLLKDAYLVSRPKDLGNDELFFTPTLGVLDVLKV